MKCVLRVCSQAALALNLSECAFCGLHKNREVHGAVEKS